MTFRFFSFCTYLLLFQFSAVSSFIGVQQPIKPVNQTKNNNRTEQQEQQQQYSGNSFPVVANVSSIWQKVGNGFKGLQNSVKNVQIIGAIPWQQSSDGRMCDMHAMQDVRLSYFIVGILFIVIFVVGALVGVIFVNYRNKKIVMSMAVQTEEKGEQNLKNNSSVQLRKNQIFNSDQNLKQICENNNEEQLSLNQNQNLISKFVLQENDENVVNKSNSNEENVNYEENKDNECLQENQNLQQNQSSTQLNGQKVVNELEFNQRNNLISNQNQQNQYFQNCDGQSVTTVESIIDDRFRDFVMNGGTQKLENGQNAISSTVQLIDDLQIELHESNNSNLFLYNEQIYQHQIFNQLKIFQNKKNLSDENQLRILQMIQSMVDNSRFQKLKQDSLQWKQKSADAQTEILNLKRKKTEIDEYLRIEKEAQQIASDCLVLGFIVKGIFIVYQCMRINYIQYMKCCNKYRKCTGFFCFLFNVNTIRAKLDCFLNSLTGPGLGLLIILFLGYILVLQQQFSVGQMRRNFASILLFFVFVVPGSYAIKLMGGSWWIWCLSSVCWCLFCLIGVDLMMTVGETGNTHLAHDDNSGDGNQRVKNKSYKTGLAFSVKAVYCITMIVLFPMLEVLLPFIAA